MWCNLNADHDLCTVKFLPEEALKRKRGKEHCIPQIVMHQRFNEQEVELKIKKKTKTTAYKSRRAEYGLKAITHFSRQHFTAGHPATIEQHFSPPCQHRKASSDKAKPRELGAEGQQARGHGLSPESGLRFSISCSFLPRRLLRAHSGWSAGRNDHKAPPKRETPKR